MKTIIKVFRCLNCDKLTYKKYTKRICLKCGEGILERLSLKEEQEMQDKNKVDLQRLKTYINSNNRGNINEGEKCCGDEQ